MRSYFKDIFAALDMKEMFLIASEYHDLVEVFKILETDNTFRTNIVLSIFKLISLVVDFFKFSEVIFEFLIFHIAEQVVFYMTGV